MTVNDGYLLLRPGLELGAFEHLDLVFHGFEPAPAKLQQLRAALVAAEQLIERQLAGLQAAN